MRIWIRFWVTSQWFSCGLLFSGIVGPHQEEVDTLKCNGHHMVRQKKKKQVLLVFVLRFLLPLGFKSCTEEPQLVGVCCCWYRCTSSMRMMSWSHTLHSVWATTRHPSPLQAEHITTCHHHHHHHLLLLPVEHLAAARCSDLKQKRSSDASNPLLCHCVMLVFSCCCSLCCFMSWTLH